MNVVRVDSEAARSHCSLEAADATCCTEFAHAIEIDEEAQEDLVGRGTVLEDTEEVRLDADRGHVSGVKGEDGLGLGQ